GRADAARQAVERFLTSPPADMKLGRAWLLLARARAAARDRVGALDAYARAAKEGRGSEWGKPETLAYARLLAEDKRASEARGILLEFLRRAVSADAVVFSVGPITDTTVPGNSRACVASKSPLTGLFFDSTFGGRFPATLKRTGFDAVVITGRAAGPSYLVVTETGALLKPADQLWGRATRDTVQAIVA